MYRSPPLCSITGWRTGSIVPGVGFEPTRSRGSRGGSSLRSAVTAGVAPAGLVPTTGPLLDAADLDWLAGAIAELGGAKLDSAADVTKRDLVQLELDSLSLVALFMSIEERFDVVVHADDWSGPVTLQTILEYSFAERNVQ